MELKPLRPASLKIAQIEDKFLKDKALPNRREIISLLDKAKRSMATKIELERLEFLVNL